MRGKELTKQTNFQNERITPAYAGKSLASRCRLRAY